jgi:hypothetical protein
MIFTSILRLFHRDKALDHQLQHVGIFLFQPFGQFASGNERLELLVHEEWPHPVHGLAEEEGLLVEDELAEVLLVVDDRAIVLWNCQLLGRTFK